jgi:hypothetical protein
VTSLNAIGRDQSRAWFALALPTVMAGLLTLVPVFGTAAKGAFLAVLVPLVIWAAFSDTERAVYVYLAWCWMDGTIRGVFDSAPVMIVARDIILGLVVIGWGLRRLQTRSIDPLRVPSISLLVTLFILNALVQVANPFSLGLVQSVAGLKLHFSAIPLLYVGFDVFRRPSQIRALFLFLTLATLVIGMVSLVQYAHGREWTWSHFPGTKTVISQNFNASSGSDLTADDSFKPPGTTSFGGGTGGFVGLVFPLPFALLLLSSRLTTGKSGKFGTAALAAILLLFTVMIFVNGLRSALAPAIFGVLLCSFLVRGPLRKRALTLAGVCLALGFAGWGISQSLSHGGVTNRFSSTFSHPDKALQDDRQTFFETAGTILANAPLGCGLGRSGAAAGYLGTGSPRTLGFSTFSEAYLGTMIFETGMFGAMLIGGIAVTVILRGLQTQRRLADPDSQVLAAALLVTLLLIGVEFFSAPVLLAPPGSVFFWLFSAILLRQGGSHEPA